VPPRTIGCPGRLRWLKVDGGVYGVAKSVFFSFYYRRDNWRVQKVMNIGAIEGQPLLNSQEWEQVKRRGARAVQDWIDKQMAYKRAVVVLVGAETASRPWVKYEISKAWKDKRPLVGIRIHGLSDRSGNTDRAGANPFAQIPAIGGFNRRTLADYVRLYNPSGTTSQQVYADIARNIESWVDGAVKRA
jgi:hypothetical protein